MIFIQVVNSTVRNLFLVWSLLCCSAWLIRVECRWCTSWDSYSSPLRFSPIKSSWSLTCKKPPNWVVSLRIIPWDFWILPYSSTWYLDASCSPIHLFSIHQSHPNMKCQICPSYRKCQKKKWKSCLHFWKCFIRDWISSTNSFISSSLAAQ